VTPSVAGLQGGNVLDQPLGAIWTNQQGFRFGADGITIAGTPGPTIANSFTIEAIVRPDFRGGAYSPFLGDTSAISTIFGSSAHNGVSWQHATNISVDQNTGIVSLDLGMASGGNPYGNIDSTTPLVSGQWCHIAAVVRGSGDANQRIELWINGVLDGTGYYPAGWETQSLYVVPGYFTVGGTYGPWFTQRNWQGQIDALAISDVALGPSSFVLPIPA
jgi:hypothetical protein